MPADAPAFTTPLGAVAFPPNTRFVKKQQQEAYQADKREDKRGRGAPRQGSASRGGAGGSRCTWPAFCGLHPGCPLSPGLQRLLSGEQHGQARAGVGQGPPAAQSARPWPAQLPGKASLGGQPPSRSAVVPGTEGERESPACPGAEVCPGSPRPRDVGETLLDVSVAAQARSVLTRSSARTCLKAGQGQTRCSPGVTGRGSLQGDP